MMSSWESAQFVEALEYAIEKLTPEIDEQHTLEDVLKEREDARRELIQLVRHPALWEWRGLL